MKRVLFLTPTDTIGASSRYRVYQFLEYIDQDIETNVYPFMDNTTYKRFKSGNFAKIVFIFPLLILKRISLLFHIKKSDTVFVHRDVIPFGPMLFEKIIKLKCKKLILDLDDAVYCNEIDEISSKKNKFLYKLKYGKRFDSAIKNADLVICGNQYIEQHVHLFNKNTVLIPTVIDTNKVLFTEKKKSSDSLTLGWVGNPGNTKYAYNILKKIDKKRDKKVRIILIGAQKFDTSSFHHIDIEFYDWNLETEYEILKTVDIGLMPLNDTEWSKGKCGLKLLQYMAVGVPGIATPIGVNSEIIIENKNGWIVENDDWNSVIDKILNSKIDFIQMSNFCRDFVEKKYSINSWKQKYNEILK